MHETSTPLDRTVARWLSAAVDRPLRGTMAAMGFWLAIVLPALYLPLLAAGIDTTDGLVAFFALLGGHLVALVAGRRYRAAGS